MVKNTCIARDVDSIPGSIKSLGEGNDNPFQYSCLGNPMEPGGLQSMGLQRVGHDCHYGINHNGKEHKQKCLCVCITESLCCTAESTVYQLYFNFKKQN